MNIVEGRGLTKTYRTGEVAITALNDVTIRIERGEFAALAGPSGSGKTTLLNMLGGLDMPDEGSVVVEGSNLQHMSGTRRADLRLRRIGFVFQSYNLIPVLSALENVEFVMLLQGVPAEERRKRAGAILDEVGLGGSHDRRPAELSGGQQQRVAVARAIVSGPSIVLADEPTANLDSNTGRGLLEMMKHMNEQRNVTFIFSTHDTLVMDYARRLVHIRDGRLTDDETRAG